MSTVTTWRKSTKSGGQQNCVEVADHNREVVSVRDTKLSESSPILEVSRSAWQRFVDSTKES